MRSAKVIYLLHHDSIISEPDRAKGRRRPPDVQRGDVAVPDGLLPASVGADLLYGQIDLDEALGVLGHYNRNNISFEVLAPCGPSAALPIHEYCCNLTRYP